MTRSEGDVERFKFVADAALEYAEERFAENSSPPLTSREIREIESSS